MKLTGRSLLLIGLFLCLLAAVPGQKRKSKPVTIHRDEVLSVVSVPVSPRMPPDVQRRYDTFIQVWQTIKLNYFDPTFSNLNWDSVRSEYEPKVKAAHSDAELHDLLSSMIGRLNRSHL